MPKNIVIFADGTGQAGGVRPDQRLSNIYKLFRASRTGETIVAWDAALTAVGRQLMTRRTDAIRDGARDVATALPRLERALADLERVENLVASVSSVLALVDKAVETARAAG